MGDSKTSVPYEFVKWFRGPYNPDDPGDKRKNYERLGYLVACNGGNFQVSGWGVQIITGGPFKGGLSQEEGIELMQLSSFINGANLVDESIFPYVMETVKEWIDKTLEEHDKKCSDGSGSGENDIRV